MIVYAYLLLILQVICGQKTFTIRDRFGISPYYNAGPKVPTGVGVLQDLSNAKILSNEPFIISFEFPRIGKSGDSRKSKSGVKRSRPQRKRNRRLRRFRHIVLPDGDLLERTKRFQIMQRRPGYDFQRPSLFMQEDNRRGKNLMNNFDVNKTFNKQNFGRFLKFGNEDAVPEPVNGPKQTTLQQIIGSKKAEVESDEETIEADNQKWWEDIKDKWASLLSKDKEPNNEIEGEQEKLKLKSHKMWANCQLLKLLKAPQRNPLFYKLLPPNYPALIMDEEKQLQCNTVYDIIDLSRDKQMIAEKIEQLEKILSAEFKKDITVPEMILNRAEENSQMRRKRDVPQIVEKSHEPENTLQDESLQGKSEGDGRSDRSRRTKNRQRNRKREEINKRKNKRQKEASEPNQEAQENERKTEQHSGSRNGRMAKAGLTLTNDIPKINKLDEKELPISPEDDNSEQKREKLEVKTDSILQDVFKPSEVNKVIKQKEREANIFDKILRVMKKFEDNNPYDESFKPRKRESRNETETILEKPDSSESILEVDDAVNKLAKIFRILGVKAEAKKCENCDLSGEDSSEEEDDEMRGKRLRLTKPGRKCVCEEGCPFCQDCLKCFRECKKNALNSKNIIWTAKQSAINLPLTNEYSGLAIEKKPESFGEETKDGIIRFQEENAANRSSILKAERLHRSKLPSSRDHVRVYFDNPENKLLVWTKRGRRTMPWAPLTSDLQLYRDRARQILKSAEDILQRIKETEEKIRSNEQYGDKGAEVFLEKNKKEKVMDDIIKKVVNEDDTKQILRTPWEAEMNEEKDALKEIEREIAKQENEEEKVIEQTKLYIADDQVAKPRPESLLQADEKVKEGNVSSEKDKGIFNAKNDSADMESKSIEAAVESVEAENSYEKTLGYKEQKMKTDAAEVEEAKSQDAEDDEYEDFPAKVEAVSNKNVLDGEVIDKSIEKSDSQPKGITEKSTELENSYPEESKEAEQGTELDQSSADLTKILKVLKDQLLQSKSVNLPDQGAKSSISKSEPEEVEKSSSYENEGEDVEKSPTYINEGEEVEKSLSYENRPEEVEKSSSYENEGEDVEKSPTYINEGEEVEKSLSYENGLEEVEKSSSYENEGEDVEKSLTYKNEDEEVEKSVSYENEPEEVEKSLNYNNGPEKNEKSSSSENEAKEIVKGVPYENEPEEVSKIEGYRYKSQDINDEHLDTVKRIEEEINSSGKRKNNYTNTLKEKYTRGKADENIFQDQIKPIEQKYIIKGIEQDKEEKVAILKALLLAEGTNKESPKEETTESEEAPEIVEQISIKNAQQNSDDRFKTLINHLSRGHMDENDFDEVKNLDKTKIDHLVGEMQKKDEKSRTTNCNKQLKLCQIACGCNGTDTTTEIDKYDIIRGFLGWLKSVQMDQMVPISV